MKILFSSSEVTPFAKTGGLADVAGTLPLALGKLGIEVLVTMPRYRGIAFTEKKLADNVTLRAIENEAHYNRAALYGHENGDFEDNLARYSYFCRQSFEAARAMGFKPDVVHAHDWQAALMPVYLKTVYAKDAFFAKAKSVFTVHNLAYQGQFPHSDYGAMGLDPSLFSMDGFEFYGKINVLKGGILFADAVTTVSPTYAREILTPEFGCGLDGVLKKKKPAPTGIVNGLDYTMWDPATDRKLAKSFSAASPAGKADCKAFLQKESRLKVDPNVPLFAMVTRLVGHKGLDIFCQAAPTFFSKDVQFVLLGEGDKNYQAQLKAAALRHPGKVSVTIGFNAEQAHRIYAGADFFLMPSHFEPCGLGQLIAMRYGAVPVVRKTGGLADTVTDGKNGFVFADYTAAKLLDAIERALAVYGDKKKFAALSGKAMASDFSWDHSAEVYKKFYEGLLK